MAVRSTMETLISFVRRKIGDPEGATQHFTADDIQEALDATRLDVFDEPLRVHIERTASAILYKRHSSRWGFYEDDYTLLYSNLEPATPDVAEVLRPDAIWTFNSSPFPPVWIQYGKSFDPYRVAADLLEQWVMDDAAKNIDFSANGQGFHLSQITAAREKRIAEYRMKQRAEIVNAARHDAASVYQEDRVARVGEVSAGVPFITGP